MGVLRVQRGVKLSGSVIQSCGGARRDSSNSSVPSIQQLVPLLFFWGAGRRASYFLLCRRCQGDYRGCGAKNSTVYVFSPFSYDNYQSYRSRKCPCDGD